MNDETPDFLPTPYLKEIGNIVVYWSYLESVTEIALWALLKIPREAGVVFTTHMNQTSRCEALSMLVNSYFHDTDELFKNTMKRIDLARVKRNTYVHALWKHQKENEKTASILKISARGKFKQESQEITLKELRDLIEEIHDLTAALQAFVEVVVPDAKVPWERG